MMERLREKGAGNPLKCVQCGACTSACLVNLLEEGFNPRKIVGSIARFNGLPAQNPWLCSTCSLCTERCPQGVDPFSIIMALRAALYEDEGDAPGRILEMVEQVRKTGFALPVSPESNGRRRLLGLPEARLSEQSLSEVRRILSEEGFR